jgi:peptide deformylase
MVALFCPLSAAAATLHLTPAAPLTHSAVAASAVNGRQWRSVRTNAGGGGWLAGLLGGRGGGATTAMTVTPGTVKAGDPVLHETAQEVAPGDVSSEKVQGIIDRTIDVMRKGPGVGLAAPQIGVPLRVCLIRCLRVKGVHTCLHLVIKSIIEYSQNFCPIPNLVVFLMIDRRLQIIVLEDTQEYISYAPKIDIEAQDRRPFNLLVSTFCHIATINISIWNLLMPFEFLVFP